MRCHCRPRRGLWLQLRLGLKARPGLEKLDLELDCLIGLGLGLGLDNLDLMWLLDWT